MTDATHTIDTYDEKAKAVEDRIKDFCQRFDVEPPRLEYEDGSLLLNDDIIAWCDREGATLDWIFCGDVRAMLGAMRAIRFLEQGRLEELQEKARRAAAE